MQRDAPLRVGEAVGRLAIAYIVKAWPRLSETFILNEIVGLERRGVSIRIFSVKDPNPGPIHDGVALVRANVTYLSPRSHWKSALPANFRSLRRRPGRYLRTLFMAIVKVLSHRRRHPNSSPLGLRALAALRHLLEAGYLADVLFGQAATHLHAHFASSPALVALLTSRITGLPYTLTAQARQLGLGDRVRLLGAQPYEAVCLAYRRAAVFALPCRVAADGDRDGIPNVLLEAVASGVPVVSTPISGIPELIECDRSGLLVEPNHPGMLADALDRILESPELRARLTEAARAKLAAHFSLDHCSARLLALFQAVQAA